jgi:hypothetical protein
MVSAADDAGIGRARLERTRSLRRAGRIQERDARAVGRPVRRREWTLRLRDEPRAAAVSIGQRDIA